MQPSSRPLKQMAQGTTTVKAKAGQSILEARDVLNPAAETSTILGGYFARAYTDLCCINTVNRIYTRGADSICLRSLSYVVQTHSKQMIGS